MRYSAEKHRNDIEMDFLISSESKTDMKAYPVEVKSSVDFSATSYEAFKARFDRCIAQSYVISPKPFRKDGDSYHIPSYMAFCLF